MTANCLKTSIPKPYFCHCKVDIDQCKHNLTFACTVATSYNEKAEVPLSLSLSLPSLPLSLSLTLSPGSVKRNRQSARGFRFAACGARLPAHSFRRAAFCVLLPVRCFRRAHGFLRAASVPRACVRVYGGFAPCPESWKTAAPAPVRETARPHALLGTAARRAHGTRAHGTRARNQTRARARVRARGRRSARLLFECGCGCAG